MEEEDECPEGGKHELVMEEYTFSAHWVCAKCDAEDFEED